MLVNGKTKITPMQYCIIDFVIVPANGKWSTKCERKKQKPEVQWKKSIENYCPFWAHCVVRQIRIVRGVFHSVFSSELSLRLTSSYGYHHIICEYIALMASDIPPFQTTKQMQLMRSRIFCAAFAMFVIESDHSLFSTSRFDVNVFAWIWWPKCQSVYIHLSSPYQSQSMPLKKKS